MTDLEINIAAAEHAALAAGIAPRAVHCRAGIRRIIVEGRGESGWAFAVWTWQRGIIDIMDDKRRACLRAGFGARPLLSFPTHR